MDDISPVSVLHGGADRLKDPDAIADAEGMRPAVRQKRIPLHELHYEVRVPLRRRAAIDQAGDVGMFEPGENLALVAEPADREMALVPSADQLDGDALLELLVGADRQIDGAHAAPSDFADELPRTHPGPGQVGLSVFSASRLGVRSSLGLHEIPRRLMRLQQRHDFGPQLLVPGAVRAQEGLALRRGFVESPV
jgi:hypothetical protein